MVSRSIHFLLLAASVASAFKNSSPFFLLSTETLASNSLQSAQISTSASVEQDLISALSKCDARLYVFIEQAGVRAADLRDSSSMPRMAKRLHEKQYQSVIQVPEVIGELNVDNLMTRLDEACKSNKRENQTAVMTMDFPKLSREESAVGRISLLKETDSYIEENLPGYLATSNSHVLIWTSSSPSAELIGDVPPSHYQMDEPPFQETMHTDMKRDVDFGSRRRQSGQVDDFQHGLPLFERYQFLSPGIFMGLTVSLLLFLILYVGVSAIAGLEVSYMAFSKEMGPQAQKKQQ